MSKFDLKTFINENKLGAYSKLDEKLDPIGKEDSDIDNDGDVDKTDDYLAKKRKAISKAIADKEKTNIEKDARKAKGMMEMEDRFVASSMEDLEQVIRNLSHTANISEDEALEMAIKKLESMLDGRDDLDEDLDVGHQDDEPGMLKNKLFRAAKMAAMLYKKVDKYDRMGGEVDFPSWWQNKINKSQDMLQSAYDYLDGEENVAKIDSMSEKKVEVDDETEFKLNLRHLLDKHAQ